MNKRLRITDFVAKDHVAAGRALICALGAGLEAGHIEGLADVLEARLSRRERMGVLACAIRAADTDDAIDVMTAALADLSAGLPVPTFLDADGDAAAWATTASLAEQRAYLVAIWRSLSVKEQRDFLAATRGRGAA